MYKIDKLTETMFELTRAGVLGQQPSVPEGVEIDWDKLMDLSMEHGLLAWVWDGICLLPQAQQPSRQYRINWGLSVQNLQRQYAQQEVVLKKMISICDNNQMRLLLLKGFSISRLYPKPNSRPSSDIDIYLFDDYEKGNQVLFSNNGHFSGKHYVATFEGMSVENHFWLIDTRTPVQRKVEKYLVSVLDTCEKTEDGYYILSTENQILHMLMHLLAHLNNGGNEPLKIRSLVDLGYLLYLVKDDSVAERFLGLVEKFSLEKALSLFVDLSEIVLKKDLSRYKTEGYSPNKDINRALCLILEEEYRHPTFLHVPIHKQIRNRWRYYRQIRWRYKYLPGKECALWMALGFSVVCQLEKVVLGMPHEPSHREELKMKRRKGQDE